MIQTNVASLSAYCVRACKIKHFTEREFSEIFSLAGGIVRFQNGNSRWPWLEVDKKLHKNFNKNVLLDKKVSIKSRKSFVSR